MKKFLSITLIIMILATSGCSFIGQKNSDDDPIIPVAIDNSTSSDTQANASAAAISGESTTSGAVVAPDVSGSSISDNQGDISPNNSLVDNGTGRGVTSNANDKNSILVTLYYRDKDGLLVPVTRNVVKQEGMAKAAISGLVDEAVTREQLGYYGLYPVLPQGTKIKGMTIKNGSAVIDFSKEFMDLATKEDEKLAVSSVVYTLTGFKTISDVSIRVDGKTVSELKNGTDLSGIKSRGNTFINSDETQLKDGYVKCDIYYITAGNAEYNYIVPVSVQIESGTDNQLPVRIFEELSKKPSNSKYFTSIPEGTKLLSCNVQEDTAVLDFSSQLTNYGGNEKEGSLINQIYYTLNQLKGIVKAKILIGGKETTLPEGTEIAVSKNLPTAFNSVMDK